MTPARAEVLGSRSVRLKLPWILLIPFFVFARPTPRLFVAGALLAVTGALLRAWSAGHIAKERRLATSGPYAHVRHPLYLGSFLLGVGVTLAAGRWSFVLFFLAFYALVYGRAIRREERVLDETFGAAYRRYRKRVPRLVPRAGGGRTSAREGAGPSASHPEGETEGRFSLVRYLRNREWEAALGLGAGLVLLMGKMVWGG